MTEIGKIKEIVPLYKESESRVIIFSAALFIN